MTNALVLLGHADPESFNARLARHYAEGLQARGATVSTVALADLKFDPVMRHGYAREQPLEPDLVALRGAIERAAHVAWIFPTYWAAPPAIVKGLVDRLLVPGWAFRSTGKALPEGLLAGRSARVVTTMDSPRPWYWLWHGRAIHAAFGRGTLRFCGFAPVRFTTLYGVRRLDESARAKWCRRLETIGLSDGAHLPGLPAVAGSAAALAAPR